jgi:hypothetical protein
MEIRNHPFEDRARQPNKADITRPNRETIERSHLQMAEKAEKAERAEKAAEYRDRLEVDSNRAVSERAEAAAREAEAERAERVRDLEQAHRNGDLNSDVRVEAAATRMLEGE